MIDKKDRDNYEIAMIAVMSDPSTFRLLSDRLKDNCDLARLACRLKIIVIRNEKGINFNLPVKNYITPFDFTRYKVGWEHPQNYNYASERVRKLLDQEKKEYMDTFKKILEKQFEQCLYNLTKHLVADVNVNL
jgi:hypothetical protein